MPDGAQDKLAAITWNNDWTAHLARVGLTMSTATVAATGGAVVSSVTPSATGVMFKLTTSAVSGTLPVDIVVTTTATLSNGDTDLRRYVITVTNT